MSHSTQNHFKDKAFQASKLQCQAHTENIHELLTANSKYICVSFSLLTLFVG